MLLIWINKLEVQGKQLMEIWRRHPFLMQPVLVEAYVVNDIQEQKSKLEKELSSKE
jgi:hypothetical protein